MPNNLPSWGNDRDGGSDEPLSDETEHQVPSASWPTRPRVNWPHRATRANQAVSDAQQSLGALLGSPTGANGTNVVSASGASRNSMGRIAAPTPTSTSRPFKASHNELTPARDTVTRFLVPGDLDPGDGATRPLSIITTNNNATSRLSTSGRLPALIEPNSPAPTPGISAHVTGQLRIVRERAQLLISAPSAAAGDDATQQSARRAAAKWATRYATHLAVVLVVGALVALGGLKTLTVQSAYSGPLGPGTDQMSSVSYGGEDFQSQDFEIILPRTELNDTAVAAKSSAQSGQSGDLPGAAAKYTVVEGDTIESVAAKFHVMPETVMGSNRLYDVQEALTVGEVLNVPPVDGMYYEAAEGDTVEGIAKAFQVDPRVINGYAANNAATGQISAGQPLVIPGGMMPQRQEVLVYTVSEGDTLRSVAARYGIDVPTLMNTNDIPDPDNLRIGSELRVLPVAGVEYRVKEGDTVSSIAERLEVSPEMITGYVPNHVSGDESLRVDQVIMVPGAKGTFDEQVAAIVRARELEAEKERQQELERIRAAAAAKPKPKVEAPAPKPAAKAAPKPAAKTSAVQETSSNTPKSGTGRMVWPVRGTITQYFSARHNGLDIAIRAGTPLHAADSGKVIWSGWRQDGLGYCVIIDHLNGLTTIYGHMIRQPPVYVGQYVDRGQVIGYVGSTGRSTGPHVHFMVKSGGGRTYRNPLAYLGK